jgi:hypothetical protein
MTPLHNQVKNLLLPALLKATGEARAVEQTKLEYDPAALDAARKAYRDLKSEWDTGAEGILKFMEILYGPPKIPTDLIRGDGKTGRALVLYSCVKFLGSVYCVSHQIKRLSWSPKLVSTTVPPEKFEIASDEEVEQWIDSLTSAALKQILIQGEFAVILEPMFETEEYENIDQSKPQIGDKVVRGPDWRYGDFQDQHGEGFIIKESDPAGWWEVRWAKTGDTYAYRMGAEGKFDLTIVEREVVDA